MVHYARDCSCTFFIVKLLGSLLYMYMYSAHRFILGFHLQPPPRCSLSFSIYESIYAPVMMCKQKRCAANIGITPCAPLWLWAAREICIERDAMSLWVDKYRPTTLSKLDYHKEQAGRLKKLVSTGQEARWSGSSSLLSFFFLQVQSSDFPHLLVYGPSGAGKKTRIMCILRELYGSGAGKLRIEHTTVTVGHVILLTILTPCQPVEVEFVLCYFRHHPKRRLRFLLFPVTTTLR